MAKQRKSDKRWATPRKLSDLKKDPQNARKHGSRNLEMIRESIARVGAGRSIVIDETGQILAGEGAVTAAKAAGLKLQVVDTDGRTLIAVRRKDLTPAQKTELAIYDNRTAELADWDGEIVWMLASQGTAALEAFFNEDELKTILMPDESGEPVEVTPDISGIVMATCPKCGERFPV